MTMPVAADQPAAIVFQLGPADVSGGGTSLFKGPIGIRCHPDGRIFVVDDLSHRVMLFDPDGTHRSSFAPPGGGSRALQWPDAMHWDRSGLLYVADTGANRIQVWTSDGGYVREFGRDVSPAMTRLKRLIRVGAVAALACTALLLMINAAGWIRFPFVTFIILGAIACAWVALYLMSPGVLHHPRDVWIDVTGEVYVADARSNVIRVFDPHGGLVRTLGSSLGLRHPLSVIVSKDGRVFVSDSENHRIRVMTKDGAAMATFGRRGKAAGEFDAPHGIALDSDGLLYVAERGNSRIQALTSHGEPVRSFTADGLPGAFAPAGICLTRNLLLAADTAGHRVVGWQLAAAVDSR